MSKMIFFAKVIFPQISNRWQFYPRIHRQGGTARRRLCEFEAFSSISRGVFNTLSPGNLEGNIDSAPFHSIVLKHPFMASLPQTQLNEVIFLQEVRQVQAVVSQESTVAVRSWQSSVQHFRQPVNKTKTWFLWCKGAEVTEVHSSTHLKLAKGEEIKEDEDSRFLFAILLKYLKKIVNYFTDKKVLKQQFLPPRVDMEISRKKLYYYRLWVYFQPFFV